MWLKACCDLVFDIEIPTPFILMLRPRSGYQQWVAREEYTLKPNVVAFEYTDGYGNLCQRIVAPPGRFSIHTSSEVMTADNIDQAPGAPFNEIQTLPETVLAYLLPSRYCESDRFGNLAMEITLGCQLGYDQVSVIVDWLKQHIRFCPGSSPVPVSAVEVNQRQQGVCRDLAHLGIALCRSLCIPARMVVGYLEGLQPMELHAWFEAYVGGRWYTFDATQNELRGGYIAVGYGRDAADVAIYNQFGPAVQATRQDISVERIPPPG